MKKYSITVKVRALSYRFLVSHQDLPIFLGNHIGNTLNAPSQNHGSQAAKMNDRVQFREQVTMFSHQVKYTDLKYDHYFP